MLETIDTKKRVDKSAYQLWYPRLKNDLRELQQKAREAGVPVYVLFEGWQMAGKADCIKHLGEALDPRGFTVHSTRLPSEEEERRPWFWRFWIRFPARGKFAFFERSWYTRVLDERVLNLASKADVEHSFQEINQTEEMLTRDGALIVKFWLHITRKEQKRRLRESRHDPLASYSVDAYDGDTAEHYHRYEAAAEEMLERTSTHAAPWIVVESNDHRYRRMKVFQTLCEALVNALNQAAARRSQPAVATDKVSVPALAQMPTVLDKVDLSKSLTQEAYEQKKITLQVHLRRLQYEMVARRVPLIIVFEGWDAAGKGGAIRRLTATLDPRFYDVIPIGKPTPEELSHHYLWRFWSKLSKRGELTIFDRSWYGRVLVERIESLCPEGDWRRAYQEINEFEAMLYRSGYRVIKFWLHITREEQERRFLARKADPHKAWKLTDEDWRNAAKWDAYRESVDEMVKRTSTTYAPWTIVEGNCKRHARVRTMETAIEVLEKALKEKE